MTPGAAGARGSLQESIPVDCRRGVGIVDRVGNDRPGIIKIGGQYFVH